MHSQRTMDRINEKAGTNLVSPLGILGGDHA
jgi:hypothetical protein